MFLFNIIICYFCADPTKLIYSDVDFGGTFVFEFFY